MRRNGGRKDKERYTQERLYPRGAKPHYKKRAEEDTAGTHGYALRRCLQAVVDIRQTHKPEASEEIEARQTPGIEKP